MPDYYSAWLWGLSAYLVLASWLHFVVAGSDWLDSTPAQQSIRRLALWLSRPLTFVQTASWHKAALFSIAFIVVLVRVWDFGSLPGGFNQDGAMAAVDAKALALYGTDRLGMPYPAHFTAWGYGQMSVLLSYMMAPLIKIFGMHPVVCRLPILLLSLAGLCALYQFIRRIYGREAAVIVLAFAAINPWHIMQSRWALDCNVLPHVFVIGLYLMQRSLTRPAFLLPAMAMFALCMYSYGVAFLSLPPFLALAYLVLWRGGVPFAWLIGGGVVYGVLALPIVLVMAINTFGWQSISTPWFTLPYFADSVRANDIVFFAQDIGQQFGRNLQSMLNVAFWQRRDLPWNALDKYGSLYLFSLPLLLLGALVLINSIVLEQASKPQRAGRVLLLLALCAGIWTGLAVNGVNINRINLIFYFSISLVGLGLWRLYAWLPRLSPALLIIYAMAFGHFVSDYFFGDYRQQIAGMFMQGFGQALRSQPADQIDTYYITQHSQFRGAKQVSEILTLFHLDIDAEYFQAKPAAATANTRTYRQRYRYVDFSTHIPRPQAHALYVLHASEKLRFPESQFEFLRFGRFYAATAKKPPDTP